MMIARWHVHAKFGHKSEVIAFMKEWDREVAVQTNIDASKIRYYSGNVGVREAEIQTEFQIEGLGDLDDFFKKIATVEIHADWGRKMSDYVVSGSSYWEVLHIVE